MERVSNQRTVLVTGGTGFLGTVLVPVLFRAGYSVHVLARDSSRWDSFKDLPIVRYAGDLLEADSIQGAVQDAARAAGDLGLDVIHAGAVLSYRRKDRNLHRLINVEGTRKVVDACNSVGVRRLVFVSSVVTVGWSPDGQEILDESAPFNGACLKVDYVDTKRAAEDIVRAAAQHLDAVIVNPGAIFGDSPVVSNSTAFVEEVVRGTVGRFAPPGGIGVVGVQDVARGVVLALERGVRGRRYILSAENLNHREIVNQVLRALGRAPRPGVLPSLSWRLVVGLAWIWDRLIPLERATPQALGLLGAHFRYDSSLARRELGWETVPFNEIIEETVKSWQRSRK